jgi:hypothetical protein
MTWVLITVLGFAAWLLVVLLFFALCRAAARGDQLVAPAPGAVVGPQLGVGDTAALTLPRTQATTRLRGDTPAGDPSGDCTSTWALTRPR